MAMATRVLKTPFMVIDLVLSFPLIFITAHKDTGEDEDRQTGIDRNGASQLKILGRALLINATGSYVIHLHF